MAANIMQYVVSFLFIGGIFLVLDLLIYFLIKGKVKWQVIILIGVLYFVALLGLVSALNKKDTGRGVIAEMKIEMAKAAEITIAQYEKAGAAPSEAVAIRATMNTIIIRPLYGWIFVSLFFFSLLNFLFVRELARRRMNLEIPMTPYRFWYGNEALVWLFMACIAAILLRKTIKIELITDVALNLLVVLVNFYGVVGGAVAVYFMSAMRVPPAVSNALLFFAAVMLLFANIFVVILFYLSIMILVPLGVFDTWFNFRKMDRGGSIWK